MRRAFILRTRGMLNKPEYWFRPRQLLRKMRFVLGEGSSSASARVQLPWGSEFDVNPRDTIAKSLLTYGVYDVAVSEVLWRLTVPGDSCLDIGANIGYMSSLLAVRAGQAGRVYSFEPHPAVFRRLETNLRDGCWSAITGRHAPVTLIQSAVGTNDGTTILVEPEGFQENQGRASIASAAQQLPAHGVRHRVQIQRLDTLFHETEQFGVMKIDVEGAEIAVLQGAVRLLTRRRIRDIVFEDFQPFPSECVTLLQCHNYSIYRLAKAVLGPVVWYPSKRRARDRSLPWEPVNYLATLDPDRAEARLRVRGWRCLRAKY
jgi:FkbM family methyltransferase